jgi:hypothetical protein
MSNNSKHASSKISFAIQKNVNIIGTRKQKTPANEASLARLETLPSIDLRLKRIPFIEIFISEKLLDWLKSKVDILFGFKVRKHICLALFINVDELLIIMFFVDNFEKSLFYKHIHMDLEQ